MLRNNSRVRWKMDITTAQEPQSSRLEKVLFTSLPLHCLLASQTLFLKPRDSSLLMCYTRAVSYDCGYQENNIYACFTEYPRQCPYSFEGAPKIHKAQVRERPGGQSGGCSQSVFERND